MLTALYANGGRQKIPLCGVSQFKHDPKSALALGQAQGDGEGLALASRTSSGFDATLASIV
jgi:hypothetical protein